jgi:hypothetical protein
MKNQASPSVLNAAQKAWATRRARAAALGSAMLIVPAAPMAVAAIAAPVIVHRSSDVVYRPYAAPVEPVIEAITEFRPVLLWLDNAEVGCGERLFVVLGMSSKKVRLFYASTLTTIEVARDTFDRQHVPVGARRVSRDRMAKIVRDRIAFADRLNDQNGKEVMNDGGKNAQDALALIIDAPRTER